MRGGAPVWYGADSVDGAWAEFYKHCEPDSPMTRYLARVQVKEVAVVNLFDQITLGRLGCTADGLVAADYRPCQELAMLLLSHPRVDGMLAPSAAWVGGKVLILKRHSVIDASCEVVEASRSVHALSGHANELNELGAA